MRSWELSGAGTASSSSAKTATGKFVEVKIEPLSRRVQGETFNIYPATSSRKTLGSKVITALEKHISRTMTSEVKPAEQATVGFVVRPVLGDGWCFWHSMLHVYLAGEYGPIERAESGGPKNKDRLEEEISMAKTAHEEFLELYCKSKSVDQETLSYLRSTSQVPMDLVQTICEVSDITLRVTISPEARPCENIYIEYCMGHTFKHSSSVEVTPGNNLFWERFQHKSVTKSML